MSLYIYAGRTLHLPKNLSAVPHLWVILTEPEGEPEKVVMVNMTSFRNNSDTTIILDVGEHRFIRHKTVIHYADARFAPVSALQEAIRSKKFHFDEDCSTKVLEKIQRGLLSSPYTPNNIKMYCKTHFVFGN